MAEFLVPPKGSCIIKCKRCKGLYIPETIETEFGRAKYEPCPFCGFQQNTYKNTIPVWMYNLLKWVRSGTHVDEIEGGVTHFQAPSKKPTEKTGSSNTELLKLQQSIVELEAMIKQNNKEEKKKEEPKKREPPPPPKKKMIFPPELTYELRINIGEHLWVYKVCDIVDSMGDLPSTGLCHTNHAYYVKAKERFVVPNGPFWSLDNPINEYLEGGPKAAALKEIDNFCKGRKKGLKETWRLTLTV